jgi:hypothetical protein
MKAIRKGLAAREPQPDTLSKESRLIVPDNRLERIYE